MTDIQVEVVEEYIKEMESSFPHMCLECLPDIYTEINAQEFEFLDNNSGKIYMLFVDEEGVCQTYTSNDEGSGIHLDEENELTLYDTDCELIPVEDINVGDICDIQPYEYGILRLKYGLAPEDLYIPKFAKGRGCITYV